MENRFSFATVSIIRLVHQSRAIPPTTGASLRSRFPPRYYIRRLAAGRKGRAAPDGFLGRRLKVAVWLLRNYRSIGEQAIRARARAKYLTL